MRGDFLQFAPDRARARVRPSRNWPTISDSFSVSCIIERAAAVDCSAMAAFCCVA